MKEDIGDVMLKVSRPRAKEGCQPYDVDYNY